ncbi:lysophospholipase L1-like esterase [Chitinophaga polysaccharea]|uniref:Lysophospholipase L1-like esterase n=1 Tax=Chitinophaga polysaccharea TaxID=1293035 RepID=A0A561PX55_9BACT|nr:SGNH/GDSL hydrolase family protein [Chitinophaga polysaccharea]TWF42691.1 lysophospholipase L1-like esterase [Chitinophaga polysaccharea]
MNVFNRRNFLRNVSLGSLAAISIPNIVTAAVTVEKSKKIGLKKEGIILFQGDSITDAGRKRDKNEPNNSAALGSGYALMAASGLLRRNADKNLKIYNKGISGNKVFQLAERWDNDCFAIKPDVLSILVGVNDYWHTLNGNYKGTVQTYRDDYNKLLDRTRQQLPDVQLIIGEPFAVKGVSAVDDKWYPAFDEYRAAAKEIADKHQAIFIPYQAIFDKALQSAPGAYWTGDGVHPSVAGAQLMAEAWLQCIK